VYPVFRSARPRPQQRARPASSAGVARAQARSGKQAQPRAARGKAPRGGKSARRAQTGGNEQARRPAAQLAVAARWRINVRYSCSAADGPTQAPAGERRWAPPARHSGVLPRAVAAQRRLLRGVRAEPPAVRRRVRSWTAVLTRLGALFRRSCRARGMGRQFAEVLEGRTYRCRRCRTHLAKMDELVSTARCFCAVALVVPAVRRSTQLGAARSSALRAMRWATLSEAP